MSDARDAEAGGDAFRRAALRVELGLSDSETEAALAARGSRESFGRLVRRLGIASDEDAARALSVVMNVPLLSRADLRATAALPERLNPRFFDDIDAAIVSDDGESILVAVADPDIDWVLKGVGVAARRPVLAAAAPLALIENARNGADGHDRARADSAEAGAGMENEMALLAGASRGAPVVKLVNEMISGAARARASDLHIETYPDRVRVRLRVDGVLQDWRTLSPRLARVVISRVKIMASLDIAERRLPQDGRARVEVDGSHYDLRVATVPSSHGEAVVIRFLADGFTAVDLDEMGMSLEGLAGLRQSLASPFGLILVVGPTGAGKSTTLAGALTELNQPGRKLISIEDPIEYQIDGVTQIAVKPSIGLTFASILRSILRSDPDVIVVGELRDRETAEMATDAALTGHLVLATLHANDAASAVPRLADLGVDPSLVRSTLRMVVAQRLVRKLCTVCRRPDAAGGFQPVGCNACEMTGYRGRTGIFEMLTVDDAILRLIQPGCSASDFSPFTCVDGLPGLRGAAEAKIRSGETSRSEVLRVLGP